MNYTQKVQDLLEEELGMRGTPYEGLLENYAQLVFTVGVDCTRKNVHDAWSVWQNKTNPEHKSLVPFQDLTKRVQLLDEPYRKTIIKVAHVVAKEIIC